MPKIKGKRYDTKGLRIQEQNNSFTTALAQAIIFLSLYGKKQNHNIQRKVKERHKTNMGNKPNPTWLQGAPTVDTDFLQQI